MKPNVLLRFGCLLSLFTVVGLVACSDDETTTTSGASSSSSSGASSSSSSGASSSSSSGASSSSSSSSSSGSNDDAGATQPTFTNVYAQVISGTCTSCHGNSHPTGLAMATKELAYTNLVGTGGVLANGAACNNGTRKRVTPSDSAQSLLWQKINHTADCNSPIPLGVGKITQAKIDLIKAWIDAGAKND